MLWEEQDKTDSYTVPDDIIDVVFKIECKSIPLDHAYALSQAICATLPWFEEDEDAALHLIHGAESGNGWQRPDDNEGFIYLSRRTRLILRIPKQRHDDVKTLSGQHLDIKGHSLKIGSGTLKPLIQTGVVFARHVVADEGQNEEEFLQKVLTELRQSGIRCRKMMCGKTTYFESPQGKVFTRSLMLADLSPTDAVQLQQKGLGAGRKLGCGIFIPHKGIKAVDAGAE